MSQTKARAHGWKSTQFAFSPWPLREYLFLFQPRVWNTSLPIPTPGDTVPSVLWDPWVGGGDGSSVALCDVGGRGLMDPSAQGSVLAEPPKHLPEHRETEGLTPRGLGSEGK